MSRWPTGVSVVTAHHAGSDSGLTVNAFLSVSLAPPILLVALTHDAESTPKVEASGWFAVNLLSRGQRSISDRFASTRPAAEKFEGIEWGRGLGNLPLLPGALATFECRVSSREDVGDHRLFFGQVERLTLGTDQPALLFYRSQYATPDAEGRLSLPSSRG